MSLPPQLNSASRLLWVAVAAALCFFSLYTAYFGVFSDTIQRPVHIGLVLTLVFLGTLTGWMDQPPGTRTAKLWAIVLIAISAVVMGYHVLFFDEIADRYGALTPLEFWFGIGAVIVVLEATRRAIGWPIVILSIIFLVYAYVGNHLPGGAAHRGYSLERIISQLYLGGGGVFGTPLGVSATFVILIVIFGAALEQSGAGKVLMDIATGLTGRSRGGPAKAAVVGSSLMGMISGTAVANVLTTGTVSIPLMKRTGYRPETAGAIEAVASTGGQLVPPVMGAAAFLMADMTGISYVDIAKAAILPALLYYVVLFAAVHFEAVKRGIPALSSAELPSIRDALATGGHLLLSMPLFIYLLFDGYSVMYTSFWAFVSVLVLSFLRRSTWLTGEKLLGMVISAGEAIIPVATACAAAGIIIGVITLTGVGLKFSSLVVFLSGGNLFLALILTMVASLILGMGLPTAAAYILVATLVAPALVDLGVNLLAAHLFVFYSAMLSSITPPVALAAYAAAALARANPLRIAMIACKFGCAAFIVPYFFAYNPALIGVDAGIGRLLLAGGTSVIGGLSLAVAVQGFCLTHIGIFERTGFVLVAYLMLSTDLLTDGIGLAVLIGLLVIQVVRAREPLKKGQGEVVKPAIKSQTANK